MKDQKYKIRDVLPGDAAGIAQIYNHYIENTIVTFEEEAVSGEDICQRIKNVRSSRLPWFVAERDGEILGYSYASRWKERCAYRYSMEVTVYLGSAHAGKGLGAALYGELLPALKSREIHVAVGVIALPNAASVNLHEKMGFLKVAHFKEVGYKFDRWIDVGCWQILL